MNATNFRNYMRRHLMEKVMALMADAGVIYGDSAYTEERQRAIDQAINQITDTLDEMYIERGVL